MMQKHTDHDKSGDGEQENNNNSPVGPRKITNGMPPFMDFFMRQVLMHLLIQLF